MIMCVNVMIYSFLRNAVKILPLTNDDVMKTDGLLLCVDWGRKGCCSAYGLVVGWLRSASSTLATSLISTSLSDAL